MSSNKFIGLVLTIITGGFTLSVVKAGLEHRDMPWAYWACWLTFLWLGYGTVIWCLFSSAFREWLGNRLGSWFSGMLKIGTVDNVSANTLWALVPVLWVLAFLYGAPDFGKDFPELQHKADSYLGKAWESKAAKPLHEIWGFIVEGSKISAMEQAVGREAETFAEDASWKEARPWTMKKLKPRYHRGFVPWILAIVVTIMALIDLPLSRRDEAKAFFSELLRRRQERSGSAQSRGGNAPPPTATSSQDDVSAAEGGEVQATQARASETTSQSFGFLEGLLDIIDRVFQSFGPFASDLAAAFTVAGVQKKGFFKR